MAEPYILWPGVEFLSAARPEAICLLAKGWPGILPLLWSAQVWPFYGRMLMLSTWATDSNYNHQTMEAWIELWPTARLSYSRSLWETGLRYCLYVLSWQLGTWFGLEVGAMTGHDIDQASMSWLSGLRTNRYLRNLYPPTKHKLSELRRMYYIGYNLLEK